MDTIGALREFLEDGDQDVDREDIDGEPGWETEDSDEESDEESLRDLSPGSYDFPSSVPPEETWKDDCILSSSRGHISSLPNSTKNPDSNLPPEIQYSGTPSLVITGGCCQTCEDLLKTTAGKSTKLHEWSYYSKLEESPTRKCNVCKIVRQTVIKHFPALSELEECNPFVDGVPMVSDTEKELGGFALHLTPALVSAPAMEIKVSKKRQDVAHKRREFGFQFRLDWGVKSRLQRIRALVNDWELDCKSLHMPCHLRNCGKGGHTELECPERVAGGLLPTRLLDVGSRLGEFVRLYVPKPGERDLYLTLSYCWGKDGHQARTTDSTFEEYKKGIPWEILPKTIQDAITVARNTGFRYLWVDGLCIIQADKPGDYSLDWDRESSQVAQYYRESAFTIAATSAEDCHQGLFLEESELSWTIPQFPIHIKVSHSEEQSYDGYLYWLLPNFKTSVIDSPLLNRGWVAQERISANRIVHFTQEGVWWECRDQYASELGGNFELEKSIKDQSFKFFEPPVWYQIRNDMEMTRRINEALNFKGMFFFKWCNAIKMFSALQFSFADDRLVAISSIAEQFCTNARPGFGRDIAYAAGLLGDYLPRGLAWMSLVSSETGSLPSWTWASVNHPVTFLELEEYVENGRREVPKWEFHINVYQCYVRVVNEKQPYGRVSFGYLALRGWLAKIPLHEYFEAGTGNPKEEASPIVELSSSTKSSSGSSNTSIANTSQTAKKSRIAWDVIQPTDIFKANPYYCLLLCSSDEKQVALVTVIDWSLCFELGSYSFKRVGMLILHKEDGIGGEDVFWGVDKVKVDIKVV